MQDGVNDLEGVPQLVLRLAEDQRQATLDEATQIRSLFAQRGLPSHVTERVRLKHEEHVDERGDP